MIKGVSREQEFFNPIILHIKMDQNPNFTPIAIKPRPATVFGKKGITWHGLTKFEILLRPKVPKILQELGQITLRNSKDFKGFKLIKS